MTDNEYPPEVDDILRRLLDLILQTDVRISIVNSDGIPQGELVITEEMPKCAECGTTDADMAFQDPRFSGGMPLCEFCHAAQAIEWERVHP